MKISCFVMMRNEKSGLDPFLDQVLEFFDNIVIVDHSSTDSSKSIVQARHSDKIEMFDLVSAGYPQEQIATKFFKREMRTRHPDWMFFLDCDEFLPFRNRAEFEAALRAQADSDIVYMHWRNICPVDLNGVDIFAGQFKCLDKPAETKKIAVSGRLIDRFPMMRIYQGYHGVGGTLNLNETCLSSIGLFHIPVQSKGRYINKVTSSALRLIEEKNLLKKGLGSHWVSIYRDINEVGPEHFNYERIALNYPEGISGDYQPQLLDFEFSYVQSKYVEDTQVPPTYENVSGADFAHGNNFMIRDAAGAVQFQEIAMSSANSARNEIVHALDRVLTRAPAPQQAVDAPTFSTLELYERLVEPLFNLPNQMEPGSSWSGHVPFFFSLMKTMRPSCYVKIGGSDNTSLCVAASAAIAYQQPLAIISLASHDATFNYVNLEPVHKIVRDAQIAVEICAADDTDETAVELENIVDILHISGIRTLEQLKAIHGRWSHRLKFDSIILVDDITVKEEGYDLHRGWQKPFGASRYFTFYHARGMGVVLPERDSPRIRPFAALSRDPDQTIFYQLLNSDVGHLVKPRLDYLSTWSFGQQPHNAAPAGNMVDQGILEALRLEDRRRLRSPMLKIKNFIRLGHI